MARLARSLRASTAGIEKVMRVFKIKAWTQDYLAGAAGCSRQSVSKFFARRPVEKSLFYNLCNTLGLEWGEIAELELEEEKTSNNSYTNIEPYTNIEVNETKDNTHFVITITGNIDNFLENPNIQAALLALMKITSKDVSITIEKIEKR